MVETSYNHFLVVVSVLVAIVASDTSLEMKTRVNAARGWQKTGWLCGGAVAMGVGIWSMHFTGMLAFDLPLSIGYDASFTGLSLVIAIVSSAFALWFVAGSRYSPARLGWGALLMGTGIAACTTREWPRCRSNRASSTTCGSLRCP
ncbi:MHYT domain-containing protein [Paraburkholderia bryophila]|uniref:NO-binding membrane sensor protein with MHYT domain n=1 Tax=Paraburkholderia bryophila TaxID=420952 RepID=A0A7Y9WHN7_9BURK|nr:MHYT domain-containing protein [Paraburkholderia bryophila]NYH21039.1 NO-binding membrane sensor protein with MHYT domain [Paraburkholderia bryophila]